MTMNGERAMTDDELREAARDAGTGWYEVIHPSCATTHIVAVHEDGSLYFPEGPQVLDRHEFEFAAARGQAHRLARVSDVLSAVADEVLWLTSSGRSDWAQGFDAGTSAAAKRIKSLIEEGKNND